MQLIRLLLCDAHVFSRAGIATIVESAPDVELVGEASSYEDSIEAARQLNHDVIVADISLPKSCGMRLTCWIDQLQHVGGPEKDEQTSIVDVQYASPVLMLTETMNGEVVEGLVAGAAGVFLRDCEPSDLLQAIRGIAKGGGYLAPKAVPYVIERLSRPVTTDAGMMAAKLLTGREHEVLGLVAEGLSNAEIGARLFVGEPTIKYHLSQLLRKLDLRDRLQVAAFAYRNGLVSNYERWSRDAFDSGHEGFRRSITG